MARTTARMPRRPDVPRLEAPASGVTVRMYRQGHGDCFLLAFRKEDGSPAYLLIDCGLKSGSDFGHGIDKIIAHIAAATGGTLDVVAITHEHDDHVTGFDALKPRSRPVKRAFDEIEVNELWLAWTEEDEPFANALRDRFNDTLIGLVGAAGRLGALGAGDECALVEQILGFELGGADGAGLVALRERADTLRATNPNLGAREALLGAIQGITNKKAIKYMRDKAGGNICFLHPGRAPMMIAGIPDVRIYSLGPPRDEELLLSLDPRKSESFELGLDGSTRAFFAALDPVASGNPFSRRFRQFYETLEAPPPSKKEHDYTEADTTAAFMARHYGLNGEADPDKDWRRVDSDWLGGASSLALRLNDEVNNTSLVLAIELVRSGKVLLFTGDAQRGSWLSWADLEFPVGDRTVTARDLLARTVLYKVGHHGSHNATLKGAPDDPWPNLSWMGRGTAAADFSAFIPAHEAWATAKRPYPWKHPLASIRAALEDKARGRVLQTDRGAPERPEGVDETEWERFTARLTVDDLHLDLTVPDENQR
ncbi:MBL fold metallo-hydrolase [Amorphus sp. MBR-141]